MIAYPYPGLRPFQRHETDIFFGREEQVEGMLQKLRQKRFVAVVGPSGCGKSSLVNAGLLPALEQGYMLDAGDRWRMAVLRPGDRPLWNMAEAVYRALAPHPDQLPDDLDPTPIAFTRAGLRRGPLGIVQAFNEARLPAETNLLVLADQFEEIFRFGKQQDADEAIAFVNLLLASAQQPNARIYCAITMRSDYLGDCALFADLPEALNDSQFLTPRLTRNQLRAAIAGPAAQCERPIDPVLVNRLLNDMGADPDQLPLLQHALMRMWSTGKELNVDLYESIGGLDNALSRHADRIYHELTAEQRRIAEILFRCLCERADGKRDTRRPVKLAEVAAIAQVDADQVAEVVEAFRGQDRHFLTPPPPKPLESDTVIDISHESLIRQWKRLRDWVEAEAQSAAIYRRLENTARLWQNEKAALWGSPDLDIALQWRDDQDPSPKWARRYGQDFKLAMTFLEKSIQKRQEVIEQKEREQKQKINRVRKRLGIAIVGLIIALCLALWGLWERDRAETARVKAQQSEKTRTRSLFESRLTHASLLAEGEDYAAARAILKQTDELDPEMPPPRRYARNLMRWYTDLMGGTADKVYTGAGAKLMNVALGPDGRLLAAVGEKGTVALMDAHTGEVVKRLEGHLDRDTSAECDVWGVVFHPQGQWLATAGGDRKIILWTLPDGAILRQWEAPDQVWALALGPDGKTLASGGTDNAVTLWDAASGKALQTLEGHHGIISVNGLAFSPDGTLLASASYDHTARLWDLETGKTKYVLRGHTANVQQFAFHPDGHILASSSDDKSIILWDVNTGRPQAQWHGHANYVFGLCFIDNGGRLISGSMDRTLRIWDVDTGVCLRVLQGHTAGINVVIARGDHIYSVANDGTIRRWPAHADADGLRRRVVDLEGKPESAAISPDGAITAIGFGDGGFSVYSLVDLKKRYEKEDAHAQNINRLSFSPDGKYIATASMDKTIKIWKAETGELIQTLEGHSQGVYAVAFAPNGKFIASASYDGRIGFFEIGKEQGEFVEAHEGTVVSVAFDASGEKLVSAGNEDCQIKLWQIQQAKLKPIQTLPKSNDKNLWSAISPDGRHMAAVGRDGLVHIFNADTGQEEHAFVGHEQAIYRVEFSSDGGQAATISSDGTLRFWDLETQTELFTIHLPTHRFPPVPAWDFAFRCTPNGDAWLAVPLTRGKLVVYYMQGVYQ